MAHKPSKYDEILAHGERLARAYERDRFIELFRDHPTVRQLGEALGVTERVLRRRLKDHHPQITRALRLRREGREPLGRRALPRKSKRFSSVAGRARKRRR